LTEVDFRSQWKSFGENYSLNAITAKKQNKTKQKTKKENKSK